MVHEDYDDGAYCPDCCGVGESSCAEELKVQLDDIKRKLKIAEESIEWQKCACYEGYQCKKHEALAVIRKEGE